MALHPGLWTMNSGPQPFPSESIYHCRYFSTPVLLAFLGHGSAQQQEAYPGDRGHWVLPLHLGAWPSMASLK